MNAKKTFAGLCFAAAAAFFLFFLWLRFPLNDELLEQETGSLMLDRHGKVLFFSISENDEYLLPPVATDDISPYFLTAALFLEDDAFFQHNGIDYGSVLRAVSQNIRSGRVVSGASTLTLQLAKKILQHRERTWINKIEEVLFALRLEAQFDKEKIFSMWANQAPFGGNIVGVHAASEFYFRKPPSELSLKQAAFLAGIPNNPERYSPFSHSLAAEERTDSVIRRLGDSKRVSEGGSLFATNERIEVFLQPPPLLAPHFVMRTKSSAAESSVLKTTLDSGLQMQIENIVERHLDFLRGNNVQNAAVIAIENETGAIRAYVGNADYFAEDTAGQVDILRSYRQAGSTLKPFLYYLAFRHLGWAADTPILDEPVGFRTAIGTEFEPKNFDLGYRGEMTVRDALAESRNIPAVSTLSTIGENKLFTLFAQLEMNSLQTSADAGLAAALGAAEVRLIDLARAYATLARTGKTLRLCRVEPCFPQHGEQILDGQLALEITEILSDNVARVDAFGEASALEFDFPVAAKTGTSRNFRDNYAIGYTPEFTVLAWVGNADGSPMQEVSGVTGAGPIFHETVKTVARVYPLKPFSAPEPRASTLASIEPLRILTPLDGARFSLDSERLAENQKIRFTTNQSAEFYVDGEQIGAGTEILWIPLSGTHRITATDELGNSAAVTIFVRE